MKPPAGQGPFQKGERLTAAKLNELLTPSRVVASGHGHSEGFAVIGDIPEEMWIRLTGKSGASTPIKYAWKQVARVNASAWQDLGRTGSTTNDYAAEINNNNVPVGNSTVYKAWRSETTAEWLFYANGTVTPPSDPCVDGICTSPPGTVLIDFPQFQEYPPTEYPSSYPNYHLTPGFECYDGYGKLLYEFPAGWTHHWNILEKKTAEIMSSNATVSTLLGDWLETEIDVSSEYANIFPMFGGRRDWTGPPLFPGTDRQLAYEFDFSVSLTSAKRFISVRMSHGGSCTILFEVNQRLELTMDGNWSETEIFFGPFGIPFGSNTTTGSAGILEDAQGSQAGICPPDGDDFYDVGVIFPDPPQLVTFAWDGGAGIIPCGEDQIVFNGFAIIDGDNVTPPDSTVTANSTSGTAINGGTA